MSSATILFLSGPWDCGLGLHLCHLDATQHKRVDAWSPWGNWLIGLVAVQVALLEVGGMVLVALVVGLA